MTSASRPADLPPLLATKLHPPRRRRDLIVRPRLAGRGGGDRRPALTLVSAPAGFGKSTFVADRFADRPNTAWLSLDPGDDDPERFWTYVLAAMGRIDAEAGAGAAELLSGGAPSETVVATLINDVEIAARDLVLVLDDYHVIRSPEVHDSVTFLLQHLPPQLSVVIATRADPPLPLASLRAAGELEEIRAADLRFTTDEATAYLNGAMSLTLPPEAVETLEARTEGWIAALQLAALSMQGRADPAAFVDRFAGDHRFILDYLADEVLDRQTPRMRDFLLDTSILGRLTGTLCAAVTGQAGAKAVLDDLDRSNMFLVPLDDRRTWYRYHHLFADVVRARLLEERPGRAEELHRRASDWFAANGEPQEAITHAFAGADPARAARLIELMAPAMQRARQESQLRRWLEALPAGIYTDRPVLAMALVGARMATGDATDLDPLLTIIDSWIGSEEAPVVFDQSAYARLPAMAAVHRAGLALLAGEPDAAVTHAQRVLSLIGPDDHLQRGAAAALVGLAAWRRGELDEAHRRYAESIACFETGGYLADVMGCSLALADIQLTQGRLRDARRTYESALRHTADHPGLRGAADMHVGLSVLAIERNDLDHAVDHLHASTELGEHLGLPQHPYRWRVATARLHEAEGDLDAALALLTEAEARYTTDYSPDVRPVHAMRASLGAARGDAAAGIRWAEAQGLTVDDELDSVREYEHLTLARVLLAAGQRAAVDQATDLLRRLLAAAEAGGRGGSAIEILVALAGARVLAGDGPGATDALRQALERAEPEGYVRTFLDARPPVHEPLARLAAAGSRYAATVVGVARIAPPPTRTRASDPDALSDRELDVLRLLRSDLSGPEVARALHVSLNTLRTHTKHIYTKLGATNRREAVTRAGELGL